MNEIKCRNDNEYCNKIKSRNENECRNDNKYRNEMNVGLYDWKWMHPWWKWRHEWKGIIDINVNVWMTNTCINISERQKGNDKYLESYNKSNTLDIKP